MNSTIPEDHTEPLRWLRFAARVIATLGAGLWLFAIIASGLSEASEAASSEAASLEGIILAILVGLAAMAAAVSWRSEDRGMQALLVAGAALGVFGFISAGHNKLLAVSVAGGPFLVPGLLLLLRRWLIARDDRPESPAPEVPEDG